MQWWFRLGVGKFGCLCVGMGRQWGRGVCVESAEMWKLPRSGVCWNWHFQEKFYSKRRVLLNWQQSSLVWSLSGPLMGFSAFLDLSQLRTSSTLESWETSLAKSAGQIMPAGSAQLLSKGFQLQNGWNHGDNVFWKKMLWSWRWK